jgi:hypothetical protein
VTRAALHWDLGKHLILHKTETRAALHWDLGKHLILHKTVTRALTTCHKYLLYLMFLTGRCQIYSQLASSC